MSHKIFETEYNIVASGSEPSIRHMIEHYYISNGLAAWAGYEMAKIVIAEAVKDMENHDDNHA